MQLIKFWRSCAPGKGSAAGENFWLHLTIAVHGLFAPENFRSSERKFPLRTFAPGSESSRELSFPSKQVRFLTTVIDIYNTQMLGAAVKIFKNLRKCIFWKRTTEHSQTDCEVC